MKFNSGNKRRRVTDSSSTAPVVWTGSDHAVRNAKVRRTDQQILRTTLLSHDTVEKRQQRRMQLHLTKMQRTVEQLKKRLESWDAVEEQRKQEEEELKRQQEEEKQKLREQGQPKKNRRKGPETWKLKGAARPAWQVYDFDTRYVCPHQQAHTEAKAKAQRIQNMLALYQGRIAEGPPVCREYVASLMQLGHISTSLRKFQSARAAWVEVMQLEGSVAITTARDDLMKLYLQTNKFDSAHRLAAELKDDPSTCVRFSSAWLAIHQKYTNQDEDTQVNQSTDITVQQAVSMNPFCAYYLAFYDTFSRVLEYADEIQEVDDTPQTSFEEALEYCTTDGVADQWKIYANELRAVVCREKPDWRDRLRLIEEECEARMMGNGNEEDGNHEGSSLDMKMYIGMFRTAMEMIQETGQLSS